MTIDLNDYNWRAAFEYAGDTDDEDEQTVHGSMNVSTCLGSSAEATAVRRKNIAKVIASAEGENDGPAWLIVVELNDGRFAFLSASCDYTGWDCQAGGQCIVDTELPHLIRFGIGEEDRTRLGLSL